ncbi:MAG: hypothetical protein HY791_38430 [Deltaproteobacteria bacterium]|nr:hypothetical protein [Deltaproteobacteria bacterium]
MSEPVSRSSRASADWVFRVAAGALVVMLAGVAWQHERVFAGGAVALGALGLRGYGELPENSSAELCRSALRRSDFLEAERACRDALAKDPTHRCRRELAELLSKTERSSEAELEIERHLRLHNLDGLGVLLQLEISKALGRPRDRISAKANEGRARLIAHRAEVARLEGHPSSDERAKHQRRLARVDAELEAIEAAIRGLGQ